MRVYSKDYGDIFSLKLLYFYFTIPASYKNLLSAISDHHFQLYTLTNYQKHLKIIIVEESTRAHQVTWEYKICSEPQSTRE